MAAGKNETGEPREMSPEDLPEVEGTPTQPEVSLASKSRFRRPLVIGGSIAAGVLALGLSFGGGYALGTHGDHGPHDGQGSFADGSGFGGRDRDRDHDRQRGADGGQGGLMPGGPNGQILPGAPDQLPGSPALPGATPAPSAGTTAP
ncbi:MAG TPA: hypothetical protein VK139_01050 [Microbacteriaceae bacterium]|nr:hypothetical protein [Microbacteriaceae bacterium]